MKLIFFLISLLLCLTSWSQSIPEIKRRVPPAGIKIDSKTTDKIKSGMSNLEEALKKINHPLKADVGIYYKAVKFALLHGEFYKKNDPAKALALIKNGLKRATELKDGKTPWTKKGIFTRGFISAIDGSYQPYGIEIPDSLDLSKKVPVWIWLHGRGDKTTDMHFIASRDKAKYKFPKEDAIIVHPLGRQCIGYKSAGETDVLEMLDHLKSQYKIDEDRIAMMGFSMGGAGAWHLGAHYAQKWAVVHPGAGFAETAEYNRLKKEDYPVWYEQSLWGLYDVPAYTRNLFNLPVVCYSGEVDKQIQAARVMERSFKEHGRTLNHLIGPKAGHKYAPGYMDKVAAIVRKAVTKGRNTNAKTVYLQTRTLRYNEMHWIRADKLSEHWKDSRIDAELKDDLIEIKTKNIDSLTVKSPWEGKKIPEGFKIVIDGKELKVSKESSAASFSKAAQWMPLEQTSPASLLVKSHGLQGPVDDAFLSPFLVVIPSKKSSNKKFQIWMEFEIAHLKKRWRELFRGDVRIKKDNELTQKDYEDYNLILWGDPECNSVIKNLKLPITWNAETLTVNGKDYSSATHAPALIYPNGSKYIVLNSGPTFRENHDRTNSLQNPKLPDWYVIDILQNPDGNSPGKVVAADFFNEFWQFKAPRNK